MVNPRVPIPFRIEQLTSINDEMVMDAPGIEEVLPEFLKFCEGTIFVAHNANFDMSFIMENAAQLNIELHPTYVDTVGIARVLCRIRRSIRWMRSQKRWVFPWKIITAQWTMRKQRRKFS